VSAEVATSIHRSALQRISEGRVAVVGRPSGRRRLATVLLAMLAVGCAAPLPTQPSADATPFVPSFVPTADPVTAAMDRRARAGLRADEAFVRLLLADPASLARGLRFGIPLTEPELAQQNSGIV